MRLVAVLVALLLAPALAHAEPPLDRPLTGARYTASLTAAEEFWHATPDCEVRFYSVSEEELREWVGGSPAAAVRAVQQGDECPIFLSPTYDEPSIENRVIVCDVSVHELGHLLGYGHSTDSTSIMWPRLNAVAWPCVHRFVPRGMGAWWRMNFGTDWATRP